MLNFLPSVARGADLQDSASVTGSPVQQLGRRDFLRLTGIAGAGLLLAVHMKADADESSQLEDESPSLDLFLKIDSDDWVTITAHRSEMGQGIRTSLPQVLADELEADWSKVRVEQAIGSAAYGNQNTDGSRSVRHFYLPMRTLGAVARQMLEQAAASKWQVPLTEVRAQQHKIIHLPTGRTLRFGELAEAAAKIKRPKADSLTFKTEASFRYIGKGLAPIDLEDFITGAAQFGIDVVRSKMVFASIERCPVIGGKLIKMDDKKARAQPGVIDIITIKTNEFPVGFQPLHGVAVIAENTWAAQQARQYLNCEWKLGENGNYSSANHLKELVKVVQSAGEPSNSLGDVSKAFAEASKTIDAVYTVPYLAHAPMEPPSATAVVTDDSCQLWVCTQAPQAVQEHVAKTLGLDKEKVTVNVTLLGGAFGRKAKADFSAEAAVLAKELGRPVKVTWTREDDIQSGYYHALSAQYFKASLDAQNQISAWLQRTSFPSIQSIFASTDAPPAKWELDLGFDELPVHSPNLQHEFHPTPASVRIGWMRSVCNIQHAFARSSFIDELAHAAGKAPPLFLLEAIGPDGDFDFKKMGYHYGNYGEPEANYPVSRSRLKNVVRKVASYGNWGKLAEGEGWGIAAHRSFVSYVAVATRVLVAGGSVHVKEVHIALDCGQVINSDRVRAQMEGSVMFGLSLALMGEITVEQGQIMQSNFDNYPLLRTTQCPTIHVHIIDSAELPGGVGEPGVPPIAPSLTNAIFAASGTRIRDLPVSNTMKV